MSVPNSASSHSPAINSCDDVKAKSSLHSTNPAQTHHSNTVAAAAGSKSVGWKTRKSQIEWSYRSQKNHQRRCWRCRQVFRRRRRFSETESLIIIYCRDLRSTFVFSRVICVPTQLIVYLAFEQGRDNCDAIQREKRVFCSNWSGISVVVLVF